MEFRLHNFAIEQRNKTEMMELEHTGYEIAAALTTQTSTGMQQKNASGNFADN